MRGFRAASTRQAAFAVKAFDDGIGVGKRIIDARGEKFEKQITLPDGTKVNVNFIIDKGESIPCLTSFSIPKSNKEELGKMIKELKDRAIELGNELVNGN